MKVMLVLADSATNHPDGTFSLLRGGITEIWNSKLPVGFRGCLVTRVLADAAEAGNHVFEVRLLDEDGKEGVLPRVQGNISISPGGGVVNLVFNFQIQFPKYGRYSFNAVVDNIKNEDWVITVMPGPKAPPQPK